MGSSGRKAQLSVCWQLLLLLLYYRRISSIRGPATYAGGASPAALTHSGVLFPHRFQPGRGHWKEGRRSPQRRNRNRSTDELQIKRRKWRQVQQEARNPAGDPIRFELRPIPQRGNKGGQFMLCYAVMLCAACFPHRQEHSQLSSKVASVGPRRFQMAGTGPSALATAIFGFPPRGVAHSTPLGLLYQIPGGVFERPGGGL